MQSSFLAPLTKLARSVGERGWKGTWTQLYLIGDIKFGTLRGTDNYGNKYFMLSVNDYQNNHNNIFVSPFKFQSSSDNNILAKVNLENRLIDYPNRIYFGPTDLTKLTISIYDEFGRIIDNNNADYSIELLCESIYDN